MRAKDFTQRRPHQPLETLMKKQVSPVVIGATILVVVLVAGVVLLRSGSQEQYGAKIPEVVMKEFKEKGPRPMPPIPMPGGGAVSAQGGAMGAPTHPSSSSQ